MTAAPLDPIEVLPAQHPDGGSVLEAYRTRRYANPQVRGLDELLAEDGDVRPGWQALAEAVDLLGANGLAARVGMVRRLLQDDGVTYAADAQAGTWRLDPLPTIVDNQDWQLLARGLAQRAHLLDALLDDVYGQRALIRDGVLPAEVVFGHDGFLRQCQGVRLPGRRQLVLVATDLVRRPGGWFALGDRAQAPSGAGYAMQNRRVVSKVMPGLYRDTHLLRLRSFFHALRSALHEVSPRPGELPRAVILTPGAPSETSFEHAFLSTLLGFPLVEGRDLQVRDEQLWYRALGRPQRVDVVLRRVDGWFCDPLELRPDSRLGVPGLLQAARAGTVAIVNPPGAGVLENGGLLPYLPALAARLLGEELLLPTVDSWWCGDPTSRAYVLSHLDQLVIRPIARGVGRASRFGWELSAAQLARLRAAIEAEPHLWSAQERLELSSTPVVTPTGLEPRRMGLRAFAVATPGGYELMPGGLARVAGEVDSQDVSNAAGALAKDVWVLAPAPAGRAPDRPAGDGAAGARVVPGFGVGSGFGPVVRVVPAAIPARVAEDLFWLGRYAERAEDAARLLRVASDLVADHASSPGSVGHRSMTVMLRAVTGVTTTGPGFEASAAWADPHAELLRIAVDADLPGSLAHALRHAVDAAYGVRELLSTDTFGVLSGMERALLDLARRGDEPQLHLPTATGRVLEGLLALAGLAAESMVRDGGWHVFDAGRRVERSLQVVQLLRHALTTPEQVSDLVLESVLIAAESVITMRRRVPGRPVTAAVLDLLLLDPINPRSVRYNLHRLQEDLARLQEDLTRLPGAAGAATGGGEPAVLTARLLEVLSALDPAEPSAVVLDQLVADLSWLAALVARTYFARVLLPQPLAVPGDEPR